MLAPQQNGLREAMDIASARASETDAKTFAVRVQEMLDSLEVDLAAMIRDMQAACDPKPSTEQGRSAQVGGLKHLSRSHSHADDDHRRGDRRRAPRPWPGYDVRAARRAQRPSL